MEKSTAIELLPLIADPKTQSLIKKMVQVEREFIYSKISTVLDEASLRILQGRLQELERIEKFKDKVIEASK